MTTIRETESQTRMASPKPARAAMPLIAAFIDEMRDAFGREAIDGMIRKATVEGLPTFYASEAGRTVGTPRPAVRFEISGADMVINLPEKEPDANRNRRR